MASVEKIEEKKAAKIYFFLAIVLGFWPVWYIFAGWFRSIISKTTGTGFGLDFSEIMEIWLPVLRVLIFLCIVAYSYMVLSLWLKLFNISNKLDHINSPNHELDTTNQLFYHKKELFLLCFNLSLSIVSQGPLWIEQIPARGDESHFVTVIIQQMKFVTLNGLIPLFLIQFIVVFGFFIIIICLIAFIKNKQIVRINISAKSKGFIAVFLIILGSIIVIIAEQFPILLFAEGSLRYGPFSYTPFFLSMLSFNLMEFSARIISCLFFIGLAFLMYIYIESRFGKTIGLLCSILFVWTPVIQFYLPSVNVDMGVLFFVMMILYQLDSFNLKITSSRFIHIWISFAIGTLYKSIVICMLPIIIISVTISLYPLWKKNNSRKLMKKLMVLSLAASLSTIGPHFIYMIAFFNSLYKFSPQNLPLITTYLYALNDYFIPIITTPLIVICSLITILLLTKSEKQSFAISSFLAFWGYYFLFTLTEPRWLPHPRFGFVLVGPLIAMIAITLNESVAFTRLIFKNKFGIFSPKIDLKAKSLFFLLLLIVTSLGVSSNSQQVNQSLETGFLPFREAFEFLQPILTKNDTILATIGPNPYLYYSWLYHYPGTILGDHEWSFPKTIEGLRNECEHLNATFILLANDKWNYEWLPSDFVLSLLNDNSSTFEFLQEFKKGSNSLYLWRF